MILELFIAVIILIAGVFVLFFNRKILAECKNSFIKPPPMFPLFWTMDVKEKSKRPGNEKLRSAIIGCDISAFIIMICMAFLLYIKT